MELLQPPRLYYELIINKAGQNNLPELSKGFLEVITYLKAVWEKNNKLNLKEAGEDHKFNETELIKPNWADKIKDFQMK